MLSLGIDLGTTNVAAAVADLETRETVDAVRIHHAAQIIGAEDEAEQSASKILDAVDTAIAGLPFEHLQQVSAVGVTGQMHGLVLWNTDSWEHSSLFTWEDHRSARNGFLDDLRKTSGQPRIYPGYAQASLGWLNRYLPEEVDRFARAGTIMDYLVARLCHSEEALIDPSNAHSWGLFNLKQRQWELDRIETSNIPLRLLPKVRPSGSFAGKLDSELARRWKIPADIPVGVACGDNPASIYATVLHPGTDISITLGTGGQLAVILSSIDDVIDDHPLVEYRPFLDERVIAVTTTLCGGKAFSWLINNVQSWLQDLGYTPISREKLFNQLNQLGLKHQDGHPLRIRPHFNGERHDDSLRGSIEQMTIDNFSLPHVSAALARGVVEPLLEHMPDAHLAGRKQVVCSGNGIRRSELLQQVVGELTGLPLVMPSLLEEAATGVALLVGDQLLQHD